MAQYTFKNMAYPSWFIEMGGHTPHPDDWSDGRLDEQKNMRDNQLSFIARIFNVKPLNQPLLIMTWEMIEQLKDPNSDAKIAEVPLKIMTEIGMVLSAEQKQAGLQNEDDMFR